MEHLFNDRINQQKNDAIDSRLNQVAITISTLLMTMTKKEKIACLKKIDTPKLERVFRISQQIEHYEVSLEIKLILEERNREVLEVLLST